MCQILERNQVVFLRCDCKQRSTICRVVSVRPYYQTITYVNMQAKMNKNR